MSPGNFSNGGVATFDEHKRYLGVRLQQGVPLLDRDWNELDDIRRFFERRLRAYYVGEGVPDLDGFEVRAPEFEADNDVRDRRRQLLGRRLRRLERGRRALLGAGRPRAAAGPRSGR